MEIRVKASHEATAVDLEDRIRQRLLLALAHCRDDVERIEVRLGDMRSRAAWRDAYCLVQVRLSGGSSATVVDVAADLDIAAERAVERAGRVASEQLSAVEHGVVTSAQITQHSQADHNTWLG